MRCHGAGPQVRPTWTCAWLLPARCRRSGTLSRGFACRSRGRAMRLWRGRRMMHMARRRRRRMVRRGRRWRSVVGHDGRHSHDRRDAHDARDDIACRAGLRAGGRKKCSGHDWGDPLPDDVAGLVHGELLSYQTYNINNAASRTILSRFVLFFRQCLCSIIARTVKRSDIGTSPRPPHGRPSRVRRMACRQRQRNHIDTPRRHRVRQAAGHGTGTSGIR